jgi:hypothetical protein
MTIATAGCHPAALPQELGLADLTDSSPIPELQRAALVSQVNHYRYSGGPYGSSLIVTIEHRGDSLLYSHHNEFPGYSAFETNLSFDTVSFSAVRLDHHGHAGSQLSEIHLTLENGRAVGRSIVPDPSGRPRTLEINRSIPNPTYEVSGLAVLLLALPIDSGRKYLIHTFDADNGSIRDAHITIGKRKDISVPAGRFHAVEVRLDFSGWRTTYWIGTDPPRRILREHTSRSSITIELER